MSSLAAQLTDVVAGAFADEGLPPELGQVVTSSRPDLGQFQCNGALAAAKAMKSNPRELATRVAERLKGDQRFADVALAGPGFLNLSLTDEALAQAIEAVRLDGRQGVAAARPQTVIVDYGGPNVAKPMHVGHIRASIIGDAIQRIARFLGHRVVTDVHLGDWGTPMGMVISELEIRHPDWPYFNPGFAGPYPAESPVSMEDLERIYPEAAKASKTDPERMERSRRATADLQAGRPGYRALWRHFVEVSVAGMESDFGGLGVHFDLWKGEADVHDLIDPMVEDLKARGIAVESEGALVVPVAEDGDRAEIPPLILIKKDGAVMYSTTDLATIIDRVRSYDPDLVLYVVDRRQHLHFEQVFRAARKAGIAGKAEWEHIGFGTMNGPDGKPFKTREGGVMRLSDLIRTATDAAAARLEEAGLAAEFDAEERERIAQAVGIGAVKFADLQNHRISNYVFNLDRMTRFEGKTGPYLQYAAVRIKSLMRKAGEQGLEAGAVQPPGTAEERDLMLELGRLPDVVDAAWRNRAPNELCDFAYGLAQAFSRFYGACHVLSEQDQDRRAGWLGLCALTLAVLERVLGLLGIEVPERM